VFTSRQEVTAREVGSAHAQLVALLAARDQWYDGTIASVDNRMSALARALPLVRRVSMQDHEMLAEAEKLRVEHSTLMAFKREMLNPSPPTRNFPRKSSVGNLTPWGRRFIATEMRQFLADNVDAVGDPDELDTRAQDHAEIATMQLPVTEARSVVAHFRMAVNWNVRNTSRPVPRQAAVVNTDFPDDALFD